MYSWFANVLMATSYGHLPLPRIFIPCPSGTIGIIPHPKLQVITIISVTSSTLLGKGRGTTGSPELLTNCKGKYGAFMEVGLFAQLGRHSD